MFSKLDIKKLSIWLLVIMVLGFGVAGTIFVSEGYSGIVNSSNSQDINVEKTLAMDNIKDVFIDTVSTDINIIPTDSKDTKVHFHGSYSSSGSNIPTLETDSTQDRINIKIKYPKVIGINFGFNNTLKLDVYIPKAFTGYTDINTVSGDLYINEYSSDKIIFKSTSGDIKASSVTTKEFTVDTASGDLTLDTMSSDIFKYHSISGDVKASSINTKEFDISTTSGDTGITNFTGNLHFGSVSGDINVEYSSFNNAIKINTTSGDSKITLPSASEFNLRFNAVSGDLRSDFPVSYREKPGNHHAEGNIGDSSNIIEVDSVSGDLNIRKG